MLFNDKSLIEDNIYNKLLSDKLDANLGYLYENVLAPQGKGVRIYHIDKRLFSVTLDKINNTQSIGLYDGTNLNDGLVVPITNSRDLDVYNRVFGLDIDYNLFDEIRLIEENGKDTFSNGGYQRISSYFRDGDSFSMDSHSAFFSDNALNDGSEFSYTVGVKLWDVIV